MRVHIAILQQQKKITHTYRYTHTSERIHTSIEKEKKLGKLIQYDHRILYYHFFLNYKSSFVYFTHTHIHIRLSFNPIGYTKFRYKNLLWIKLVWKFKTKNIGTNSHHFKTIQTSRLFDLQIDTKSKERKKTYVE